MKDSSEDHGHGTSSGKESNESEESQKSIKDIESNISDQENQLRNRDDEQWVVVPPTETQTQRHNVIKSLFGPTAEAKRGVGSIADCFHRFIT